jgi:hypothetical protein
VRPPLEVKPKADRCVACHTDVHQGEFDQDCSACHTESGFAGASFDHVTTRFPLTGAHATTACDGCHKGVRLADRSAAARVIDFRGLETTCVACHVDPHASELGTACETCHTTESFKTSTFSHSETNAFFSGSHADVECSQCHKPDPAVPVAPDVHPVQYKAATTTCVSCHADVHLGQVGTSCETCHAVDLPKFQLTATFTHAKTTFPLTGEHAKVPCRECHKTETALFPSGRGTATSCHADPHLGQIGTQCDSCHDTTTFDVPDYVHRNRSLGPFFSGRHASATCASCHPRVRGQFAGGAGEATNFSVGTQCVNCHRDVHNGSLGTACIDCHKP